MPNIILKTDNSHKAERLVKEALQTETARLKYSFSAAMKRLQVFENRYGVSSEKFISEWTSEYLEGKDLEYVEWAGEFELAMKLKENISTLESNAEHKPHLGFKEHKHLPNGKIIHTLPPDIHNLLDEVIGCL